MAGVCSTSPICPWTWPLRKSHLMDRLSRALRSENMRRIRRRDTAPELAVARVLRAIHLPYRRDVKTLPGSPDFLVREGPTAIFVHGCFWHQHSDCIDGRSPKSRIEYWRPKLAGNVRRDARVRQRLRRIGIGSMVIWECQALAPDKAQRRIRAYFTRRARRVERLTGGSGKGRRTPTPPARHTSSARASSSGRSRQRA